MATYWSTYGNPDWYKQNINPQDAQTQANRLGISTDQLFQLYAQTNLPGYGGGTIPSGGLQPTQQQLMQFARGPGLAGAAQQQQGGPQQYGPQPTTTSQGIVQQTPHGSIQPSGYQGWAIPAPPSASGAALSGMYGPMATWQNVTGQGNQPAGLGQFLGQAAQLSPQQFQFQVPQQIVPKPVTGQTVVPTAQPGAQPVKQYQSGGLVTKWKPTSTDYTAQMLQGGPSPGPTSFGTWTDTQLQQLRQAGVTMGDLQNLGLLGPPQMNTPVQNWTSGGGSGGSSGSTIGGQVINPGSQQQQQQNAILLKLITQGQQQPAQASQPPTWNQVGQAAGLSQADINQFQAMGRTPAAIAQQFNIPGLGQGFSPQQAQFQVPQQVVPQPVAGQPVVPVAQPSAQPVVPVKQFQSGGLVTSQPSAPANYYGTQYPLYATGAQGNPTGQAIYANPLNQLNLLGAAATYSVPIINQAPSGTPSSKSGVAPTGGALVGTGVPQIAPNWDMIANQAGLSSHDVAQFIAQGMTPTQAAQKFNVAGGGLAGPWTNPQIGSVFTPVARTAPTMALGATPLQPAVQPTATAYNPVATPFAQAPPAPGVQIPQSPLMMAHTSALADAGKALFAHFGGDPNSASPADIAKFHNQLTDTITNYTAGATRGGPGVTALAAASQPTAAKKMQRGGVVPGRGNEDTVPALLTPGEYIIPKPQVQQLMRTGRLPIKMAGGGSVQDPDPDPNAPPEARRKPLTAAAQTQSTPPPAAPGGGYSGSSLVPGLATAAHAYNNAFSGRGGIPAGSTAGAGAYGTVGDLMAGQGSAGAAGSLGKLPAGGLSSPGAQSALGGVASGLEQASKAIAASAPPWQVQSYQQPFGSGVAQAPQVQMQAPPAPQQAQQGGNQYAAYAMNQARYPTSPYYT